MRDLKLSQERKVLAELKRKSLEEKESEDIFRSLPKNPDGTRRLEVKPVDPLEFLNFPKVKR